MYGRKITNINRHKHFAPENAKNKQKVTEAQEEHAEKQKEEKAKSLVLQKERVNERYQELADGSDEATAKRKLRWMYEDPDAFQKQRGTTEQEVTGAVHQKEGGTKEDTATTTTTTTTTTTASSDSAVGEKRKRTGAISDEEAAEIRRSADAAKKQRRDPMQAVREAEQRQLASAVKLGTTAQPHTAGSSFNKARSLELLKKAAALKKANGA